MSKTAEGQEKLIAVAQKELSGTEIETAFKDALGGDVGTRLAKIKAASGDYADVQRPGTPSSSATPKKDNITDLFKDLQLNEEEKAKVLEKILWSTERTKPLAAIAAATGADLGKASSRKELEAAEAARRSADKTAPSAQAQAQASDKAAEPGVAASAPASEATPATSGPATLGAPPAVTVAAPPPLPPEVTTFQDAQLDQLGYLGGQNDDIIKTLKKKVGLNKALFQSEIAPILEESILNAVRVALVEYKLYKDVNIKDFVEQVGKIGFDPKKFGPELLKAGKEKKLGEEPYKFVLAAEAAGEKKQAGGYIVGQNPDGTAKVLRPPAGEMPTYIGPGETIVPKGGRGGTGGANVSITVNGVGGNDLARMVEVAATDAILKYKRREGLH
jgi:hypothetical protein